MIKELRVSRLARNMVILGLSSGFVFLVAFSFLATKSLINRPFPGFLVMKNNIVCLIYLPNWEGIKRGIKAGDIVEAVDGHAVKDAEGIWQSVRTKEPGALVTYTFRRGDTKFDKQAPVNILTLRDFLICYLFWSLIGMIFLATALGIFYLRPNWGASWAFLSAGVTAGYSCAAVWEFCATNLNYVPLYLFPLIGPSAIFVGSYFPLELKRRRYFLVPGAIMTALVIFFYRYSFSDVSFYKKVDRVFWIYTIITLTVGLSMVGYSFIKSADSLTRRKTEPVVYGLWVAFACMLSVFIGGVLLKKISFFWMAIPCMLFPLCIGYAIAKRSLLDVETFFFTSLRYLVFAGAIFVIYFAVIGGVTVVLQDVSGESSSLAAVVITLIMVAVFRPLERAIEGFISRRFFERKHEYHDTIKNAIKVLASIIELDELLYQILDTILFAIKSEKGIILLTEKESGKFYLAAKRDFSAGFTPMPAIEDGNTENYDLMDEKSPVYKHLETSREGIQVTDIEYLDAPEKTREAATALMRGYGIVLAVPIISEWRLIGVLGLGAKKSGERYSKDDIDVLQTLMMQTAVSIENARKVQELKKMVELETSYRELSQLNVLKDNFLSMVSHDLRTPMTSIKGYASLLYESPEKIDKKTTKEFLAIIMDETDRLTRLINNILDIQRFEAGDVEMEMTNLDITALVNDALSVFYSAATIKNIAMDKQVSSNPIIVKGHRDRLHQVLANFLSNAIKFTPEGGRVKAFLERIDVDQEPAVRVSISDTGPGIPKEKKNKLFQKFQQVEKLVRQKEEGSGLGLALAREIIEYHQGKIGVESYPGRGSVFYFILRTCD